MIILRIKLYKPNNNTKLITKPIRPDASTKEKPMNEKRNNSSRWEGFLLIEYTKEANMKPTPIATPVKAFEAIAPATNLKPITKSISFIAGE